MIEVIEHMYICRYVTVVTTIRLYVCVCVCVCVCVVNMARERESVLYSGLTTVVFLMTCTLCILEDSIYINPD